MQKDLRSKAKDQDCPAFSNPVQPSGISASHTPERAPNIFGTHVINHAYPISFC